MGKRKRLRIEKVITEQQPECEEQEHDTVLSSQLPPGGSMQPKKVRGPTLMSEIWELEEGERIIVKFNERHQPIGDEGCTLIGYLGSMVRRSDLAPIHFITWCEMPQSYKDEMWRMVEDLMKKGLGDSISTGTSDDLLSLDGDIFSHVKGPEKPGRIRCVGQLATSKKFEASSSQTKQPSECCAEWKERVVGLEALLGSLIVFMQKENLNNINLNEFISAAKQLCNKETPDAGSALIISPARLPSSSNDSNQNGTSIKS